jgi:hypothetical protein
MDKIHQPVAHAAETEEIHEFYGLIFRDKEFTNTKHVRGIVAHH